MWGASMGTEYCLLTKTCSQLDSACTVAEHILGITHCTRRPGLKRVPCLMHHSPIPRKTHPFLFHRYQATELENVFGYLLVISSD